MMNSWSLRDEILALTHRWPVIVACFLIGSLLGWGAAILWPSPYRATADLYVALDPYRAVDDRYVAAYAGDEFRNVDDYKYWQMEQLDGLAFFDDYLQETLVRLASEDPYWNSVEVPALRNQLHIYWRNAGKWRLVAQDSDAKRAAQAVMVWRDVIFEKTSVAISSAQSLFLVDLQLRAVMATQVETNLRQAELEEIQGAITLWRDHARRLQDNQPLEASERLYLSTLAARAADWNAGWQLLLESIPPPESPRQEYLPWIDRLVAAIAQANETVAARLIALEEERANLTGQWQRAYQNGRGLAATLLIERPTDTAPAVKKVRPTGLAALIGGGLGVLVFGMRVLISASRKTKA